jgi:hypothetical protein
MMKKQCTVFFAISMLIAAAAHAQISYYSHVVTSSTGGVLTGELEPGELFEIEVTTTNAGSARVSRITSSLITNQYFTSVQSTDSAYSLNAGSTRELTYRVQCSPDAPDGLLPITLVNSISGTAWTNVFYIDVVKDAVLSAGNITLSVVPGQISSGYLTVKNFGNAGTSFTVDGTLPVQYTFDEQTALLKSFWSAETSPATVFSWTSSLSQSDELEVGFAFSLYGTEYTTFSAGTNGTITLTAADGSQATLTAYPLSTGAGQSSLRYRKAAGRLVVAWNNNTEGTATGPEFQAWLNADGTLEYVYASGDWDADEVGLADSQISQSQSFTPGLEGWYSLRMEPVGWISYETSGVIGAYGTTATVLFTADATGWSSGTTATIDFTASINWGDESVQVVVTVVLEEEVYSLDVPSSIDFSGPAGSISLPEILTITNSGNVALSYTIRNNSALSAGYDFDEAEYGWRHIPDTLSTVLDFSETDAVEVAIGFPFVFYGTTYSYVTVTADGMLTFDGGESVEPFSAELEIDDNAQVRYFTDAGRTSFTVNWLNMNQPDGGEDQTFEAVLYRSGTISCNYQELDSGWTSADILVSSGTPSTAGTLVNDSTTYEVAVYTTNTTIVTNLVIGNFVDWEEVETITTNFVTSYYDTVYRQALSFTPAQRLDIISYSPVSGTVAVDGTADITLQGDARDLTAGGANDVDFTSTLAFLSEAGTDTTTVNFTATGSAETAYPEMAAAAVAEALVAVNWGTDTPVVSAELNSDGSRTLSWDEPSDGFSRLYTLYSSTDLAGGVWELVGTVTNLTSYVDTNDAPVLFYKVEVGSVTE